MPRKDRTRVELLYGPLFLKTKIIYCFQWHRFETTHPSNSTAPCSSGKACSELSHLGFFHCAGAGTVWSPEAALWVLLWLPAHSWTSPAGFTGTWPAPTAFHAKQEVSDWQEIPEGGCSAFVQLWCSKTRVLERDGMKLWAQCPLVAAGSWDILRILPFTFTK